MSLENNKITADVVEVREFPNLANEYRVTSVPLTVVNEVVRLSGVVSELELLEKVTQVGYAESEEAD